MSAFRRPAWWSVLLTVAGALLFVRLGVWQLHRAADKEALLRRYATAATAPARDFDLQVATKPPADAYPRVRVTGHYLTGRIYLLDNPKHDALGGVEVYAPLVLDDQGPALLADLGFLPGHGTDAVPQLPPLPAGKVSVQGLYVPPPGVALEMGGDALAQQQSYPKKTIYLDLGQVSRDLGRRLYPRLLALDPDPASIYVREHTLDFSAMPPSRHRAYAFQWFTFAVAAVVIFLVLHRKRRPRPRSS